jgi:hypothetical protein
MNGFGFVAVLPGDMYGRFVDRISYRVGGLFVYVLGRIQISEISEGVRIYDRFGYMQTCVQQQVLLACCSCLSLVNNSLIVNQGT